MSEEMTLEQGLVESDDLTPITADTEYKPQPEETRIDKMARLISEDPGRIETVAEFIQDTRDTALIVFEFWNELPQDMPISLKEKLVLIWFGSSFGIE